MLVDSEDKGPHTATKKSHFSNTDVNLPSLTNPHCSSKNVYKTNKASLKDVGGFVHGQSNKKELKFSCSSTADIRQNSSNRYIDTKNETSSDRNDNYNLEYDDEKVNCIFNHSKLARKFGEDEKISLTSGCKKIDCIQKPDTHYNISPQQNKQIKERSFKINKKGWEYLGRNNGRTKLYVDDCDVIDCDVGHSDVEESKIKNDAISYKHSVISKVDVLESKTNGRTKLYVDDYDVIDYDVGDGDVEEPKIKNDVISDKHSVISKVDVLESKTNGRTKLYVDDYDVIDYDVGDGDVEEPKIKNDVISDKHSVISKIDVLESQTLLDEDNSQSSVTELSFKDLVRKYRTNENENESDSESDSEPDNPSNGETNVFNDTSQEIHRTGICDRKKKRKPKTNFNYNEFLTSEEEISELVCKKDACDFDSGFESEQSQLLYVSPFLGSNVIEIENNTFENETGCRKVFESENKRTFGDNESETKNNLQKSNLQLNSNLSQLKAIFPDRCLSELEEILYESGDNLEIAVERLM